MSKKTFVVWYNVIETWKVCFEAESMDEAEQFVTLVAEGDQPIEWLHEAHNGWEKNKGLDVEFDLASLEDETV
jgi:hypothetical protein